MYKSSYISSMILLVPHPSPHTCFVFIFRVYDRNKDGYITRRGENYIYRPRDTGFGNYSSLRRPSLAMIAQHCHRETSQDITSFTSLAFITNYILWKNRRFEDIKYDTVREDCKKNKDWKAVQRCASKIDHLPIWINTNNLINAAQICIF